MTENEFDLQPTWDDDWGEDHRSGVVAVIGRPNVGKSTLINSILGQKIAIATAKPQTTRRNQLGIYTDDKSQILFTDTPGLHKPQTKLGEYMMTLAEGALKDADVNIWILDASESVQKSDLHIAETLKSLAPKTPLLLVLNKIDKVKIDSDLTSHREIIHSDAIFDISALKGESIDSLMDAVIEHMPLGPRYYPVDQVSDVNMRFIAGEIVREKVLNHTEKEIPHSVAVVVTDYKEDDNVTRIYATIYVERDSQKGIIIGKKGQMIKQLGIEARAELEAMIDEQVFLDLRVKVLKNWRSNENFMRRVGYRLPKEKK